VGLKIPPGAGIQPVSGMGVAFGRRGGVVHVGWEDGDGAAPGHWMSRYGPYGDRWGVTPVGWVGGAGAVLGAVGVSSRWGTFGIGASRL
jgi:hypothetical protein